MKAKLLNDQGEKVWALAFDTGDEVIGGLTDFAVKNHLGGSHFTAIGAFREVTFGYFEWETKKYKHIPVPEQVEVLSLVGDIAVDDKTGKPKVHAHVVVGKSDGSAHGGHLIEAHVRPTLEVTLAEAPRYLHRKPDPDSGLALIRL